MIDSSLFLSFNVLNSCRTMITEASLIGSLGLNSNTVRRGESSRLAFLLPIASVKQMPRKSKDSRHSEKIANRSDYVSRIDRARVLMVAIKTLTIENVNKLIVAGVASCSTKNKHQSNIQVSLKLELNRLFLG